LGQISHVLDFGIGSKGWHLSHHLQRLLLIQQLQSAGLSLKECEQCLDAKL